MHVLCRVFFAHDLCWAVGCTCVLCRVFLRMICVVLCWMDVLCRVVLRIFCVDLVCTGLVLCYLRMFGVVFSPQGLLCVFLRMICVALFFTRPVLCCFVLSMFWSMNVLFFVTSYSPPLPSFVLLNNKVLQ